MKTGKRTGRPVWCLLALIVLLSLCAAAAAELESETMDIPLVLAQDAVETFGLKDAQGQPLTPREATEMGGRGVPAVKGEEPDYRGVVGFMALQSTWEVSRFNTFNKTPWMLAVYEQDGEDWKQTEGAAIRHKTPVLVVDQRIREGMGYKFTGYLQVVRLDTKELVWVDVTQFVTVPYWTLDLKDAVMYGYCIAVYREKSGSLPLDKKRRHGPLPDGTKVLMCDRMTARYVSSDPENNPLLGIIFRSREESKSYFRTFLFFNPDDLTLVY